jgi:hypothetical protein
MMTNSQRKYIKRRKIQTKKWFREEILAGKSCSRCPQNHPATLDFHHVDPSNKVDNVLKMVNSQRSKKMILNEVAKCIILCANCHRVHHHDERQNIGDDE